MKERIRGTSEISRQNLSMRILSFMYAKWSTYFVADPYRSGRLFYSAPFSPVGSCPSASWISLSNLSYFSYHSGPPISG